MVIVACQQRTVLQVTRQIFDLLGHRLRPLRIENPADVRVPKPVVFRGMHVTGIVGVRVVVAVMGGPP